MVGVVEEMGREEGRRGKGEGRQRDRFQRTGWFVLVLVALAVAWGLLMVWSVSYPHAERLGLGSDYFFRKQAICAAVGFVGLVIAWRMGYVWIQRSSSLFLLCAVGLLVLTVWSPLGRDFHGARRGLALGPFVLQASELAKLALVLYLATYLSRNATELRKNFVVVAHVVLVTMGLAALVFIQPHLSGACILIAIGFFMLFLSGARKRHLMILVGLGIALGWFSNGWLLNDYQKERIKSIFSSEDPLGEHYQKFHARIALGSGGWFVRLFQGKEKFYLPAAHTDFIFAVIGEEGGLLVTLSLLVFYVLLTYCGFSLAEACKDQFGSLLCGGLTAYIAGQAILNIGVNLGVLPTTGVTLPFMSAGGSSLISNLLSIGLMLNVNKNVNCNRDFAWRTCPLDGNEDVLLRGWDGRTHLPKRRTGAGF